MSDMFRRCQSNQGAHETSHLLATVCIQGLLRLLLRIETDNAGHHLLLLLLLLVLRRIFNPGIIRFVLLRLDALIRPCRCMWWVAEVTTFSIHRPLKHYTQNAVLRVNENTIVNLHAAHDVTEDVQPSSAASSMCSNLQFCKTCC